MKAEATQTNCWKIYQEIGQASSPINCIQKEMPKYQILESYFLKRIRPQLANCCSRKISKSEKSSCKSIRLLLLCAIRLNDPLGCYSTLMKEDHKAIVMISCYLHNLTAFLCQFESNKVIFHLFSSKFTCMKVRSPNPMVWISRKEDGTGFG